MIFSCCRENIQQPSKAYVNDVIGVNITISIPSKAYANKYSVLVMQIPMDWEIISMRSDNKFVDSPKLNKKPFSWWLIEEILGKKEGYGWIFWYNYFDSELYDEYFETRLAVKMRIGEKAGQFMLDYACGISSNFFFTDLYFPNLYYDYPIVIFEQKAELEIQSPCSSLSNHSEVFLDFENRGSQKQADFYFVFQDASSNLFSYPNWSIGLSPFMNNITIPKGIHIENEKILDIIYPSEKPLIKKQGYHTFYFATSEPDKHALIGEIVNHQYLVGNDNPRPVLLISGYGGDNSEMTFDASNSWDSCDESDELLIRFDFEGDGIWDTPFQQNKIETHRFASGFYKPIIELKDSGGLKTTHQQELEIDSLNGKWFAYTSDNSPSWYDRDRVDFRVDSSKVTGNYRFKFYYYYTYSQGYEIYEETKAGYFSSEITSYYFTSTVGEWGRISGDFNDCKTGKIIVENYDDYIWEEPVKYGYAFKK